MIHHGDVRDVLPTLDAKSVQCVITSPPYWGLRDYGVKGQIGLEATPEQYVQTLVAVFREVRRVLRDDGTLWLNMGDSYASSGIDTRGAYSTKSTLDKGRWSPASGRQYDEQKNPVTTVKTIPPGLKPKDLIGLPWRVAFALQADGWYLRSDIIWHKPNPMPESVTDRPTKSHEYLFLLTKSARYYYDADAVREGATCNRIRGTADYQQVPGGGNNSGLQARDSGGIRNLRSVWTINTQSYSAAHFATFPTALVEPCVKAGSKTGDLILDPFAGSGTVGCVALKLGRTFVGIELNADYCTLARESIEGPLFARSGGS